MKTPAELAQKAHQAFVRLPYESSQERIVDELARLLAGIKVRSGGDCQPATTGRVKVLNNVFGVNYL